MKKWKVSEIEWLKEAYKTMSAKSIAEHLGMKKYIVEGAIRRHGIKCNRNTQFKPGNIPVKGKKYPNCCSFKPGCTPANKMPIGSITIRKRKKVRYKFIKLPSGWTPMQYVIWESAHGSIPDKHLLLFRDGDTLNCELSNLQLVSCADNMRTCANNAEYQEKRKSAIKDAWYKEKLRKAYGMGPKTGYGKIIGNL